MINIERHLLLLDRCSGTLELLQKCRDIVTDQKFELARYDNEKDWTAPIRLMHYRTDFTDRIIRYSNLAAWLSGKYLTYVRMLSDLTLNNFEPQQNLN